ncbi:hypothetical protein PZT57_26545 [Pseudomonas aeruginosa]|uniref:hypothetical protein n=1 Tax=Pseudomonas aeruginosa TaxID=287 RepID=UPI002B27375C|nr:hypothetical protein [Pseudomonas aeruginosa]MEA8592209.1 hypothetical protein [Pseudomonas aeruginosa]
MIDKKSTFTRPIQHPDLGEIVLTAEISPCVWMYNSDFQLTIRLPGDGGDVISVMPGVKLKEATSAHVNKLLHSVQIKPCSCEGCSKPAFDPAVCRTNRDGKCETCWMAEWRAGWEAEQAEEDARVKQERQDAKAKGFTHAIDMVVHPEHGDDIFLSYYVKDATPEMAVQLLRKEGSTVLDDYRIEVL